MSSRDDQVASFVSLTGADNRTAEGLLEVRLTKRLCLGRASSRQACFGYTKVVLCSGLQYGAGACGTAVF